MMIEMLLVNANEKETARLIGNQQSLNPPLSNPSISPFFKGRLRRILGGLSRIFLLVVLSAYHLISLSSDVFALEISHVFNARLHGGQYFFENNESNVSGNIAVHYAPALAFTEQWSLLPSLSSTWRGTKSVRDLIGAGTLFQQTQDHSFSIKGIYSPVKAWQFKGGGGYRIQLLKETQDEAWGKGLFDHHRPNINLEAERIFGENFSARLGYDLYWIDYKNFSTLESQQRDLGRENAGAKTLNTTNHAPYLAAKIPFPFILETQARLELNYFFTMRNYAEQRVVRPSGDLSGELRQDQQHIFTAGSLFPFPFSEQFKILSELRATFTRLSSNQHNYDARVTRFNENFYAYREWSVGPNANFIVGKTPWVYSLGFTYRRRDYENRPIQDGNGAYLSDPIQTDDYYANLGVIYPITKNFKVQLLGNFAWVRSNMRYEKTYRYNYVVSTYLMGVTYEY